eukprot:5906045-Pleurochrysis_carterae.AAC.3
MDRTDHPSLERQLRRSHRSSGTVQRLARQLQVHLSNTNASWPQPTTRSARRTRKENPQRDPTNDPQTKPTKKKPHTEPANAARSRCAPAESRWRRRQWRLRRRSDRAAG